VNRSNFRKQIVLRNQFFPYGVCGILLLLLVVTGCQKGVRPVAPVSGLITLDGKPLAGGSIVTQPAAPAGSVIAGKGSVAFCGADGRFQLKTLDGLDGAVVGEHRIRIYGPRKSAAELSAKDGPVDAAADIVPKKYNRATELKLSVPPEGTAEANFTLTSKK
jgi:hypothetical protein